MKHLGLLVVLSSLMVPMVEKYCTSSGILAAYRKDLRSATCRYICAIPAIKVFWTVFIFSRSTTDEHFQRKTSLHFSTISSGEREQGCNNDKANLWQSFHKDLHRGSNPGIIRSTFLESVPTTIPPSSSGPSTSSSTFQLFNCLIGSIKHQYVKRLQKQRHFH